MQKLIILILFFLPFHLIAKDYQVKLQVRNLPQDARPLLLNIYNGNMYIIDSLPQLSPEEITFRIPGNTPAGMCRGILGFPPYALFTNAQPVSIDFLFNREDIQLSLDFKNPIASVEVLRSKENQLYFDFLKSDAIFYQKLGLLEQVVMNYPTEDEFYRKALEYYQKIQSQRNKFIDQLYADHRKMLAGKIIKNQKLPFTTQKLTPSQRDSVFRKDFLAQIDFSDTTLLYTNVYTDKVYQYIQAYMDNSASPRENEANCIRALDELIPHLDANPLVQQNLLQFLIAGFESMKMEEVLAHISSNYLQQCGSSREIIKRRLSGYSKMAVGNKVPDFTLSDIHDTPVNLYSQLSPYTLLIFWHTDCSHCQLLMQELLQLSRKDLFNAQHIRILGISIDEDRENWKKFSGNYALEWINTHTEGSFDSPVAEDYNLFATPTMFLLDNDFKILAKPTTIGELEKDLGTLK